MIDQEEKLRCIQLFIRLIGLHSNKGSIKPGKNVFAHGSNFIIKYCETFPGNISYFICYEEKKNIINREPLLIKRLNINNHDIQNHIVVCFNWFSPNSFLDLVNLGVNLLVNADKIEEEYHMFSKTYFELAKKVYYSEGFMKYVIDEYKINPTNTLISFSGFSMGSSIASILNFLVKNNFSFCTRCIAIGAPKPGTKKYRNWLSENDKPESYYVLLSDGKNIDPIAYSPSGFAVHPNCSVLSDGKLIPLDDNTQRTILHGKCNTMLIPWDKLHSITRYYENSFKL